MKTLRNFEATFVIVSALAILASFATASAPVVQVAADPVVAVAQKPMPVVTVTAKRLTAAEKTALI